MSSPPLPAVSAPDVRPRRRDRAAAGIVAALAALAATEVLAAVLPGAPSLLLAVGAAVIDLQPPGAKELVVAVFGTNDKLALELFILLVTVALGAGIGLLAARAPGIATAAIGALVLVGFAATLRDPQSVPAIAAISAAAAFGVGTWVLGWLSPAPAGVGGGMPDWSRRGFLVKGGSLAVAAVAIGAGARFLVQRARSSPAAGIDYPPPSATEAVPAGAELDVPGITPLVVPNDRFYRIDTALLVPSVDPAAWRLRIHGMVERETSLTFDDLLAMPHVEQHVTIACVSNEVGGDLVGNALWTGVPLRDMLAIAGIRPGASQLVGRSVDGWTAGMPTSWVTDPSREAMIALRMNGAPLPPAHGFPARLIVPGLYGYVSATKWLSELELTTLEAFDAYWIPLGWAKEAPILTQSRIDVPRPSQRLAPGRVAIAGVAWAPDRGIRRVEVAVDGEWRDARLSSPISGATWVQWLLEWDASPGRHELRVRATDGTGEVQTADRSNPAPDGARGHHGIVVDVAG